MANEGQVRNSLTVLKTDGSGKTILDYRSNPTAYTVDVTGSKGPTPGAITVSTAGTDVDLSELTTPGLCRIANVSVLSYMEVGIWDPAAGRLYLMMELDPGESNVIKLSRDIQEETGTGDPGTAVLDTDNRLRLKAIGASGVALVEAFEK